MLIPYSSVVLNQAIVSLRIECLVLRMVQSAALPIFWKASAWPNNLSKAKPPSQDVLSLYANPSGSSSEKIQRFLPLLFPLKWRIQHPDYLESLPKIPQIFSDEIIYQQLNAIIDWPGTCSKLGNIRHSTLVIVGTDDVFIVPANSALIAERIPGARLVQIEGGHGLMFQYPNTFNKTVKDFLLP